MIIRMNPPKTSIDPAITDQRLWPNAIKVITPLLKLINPSTNYTKNCTFLLANE